MDLLMRSREVDRPACWMTSAGPWPALSSLLPSPIPPLLLLLGRCTCRTIHSTELRGLGADCCVTSPQPIALIPPMAGLPSSFQS